MRARAPRFHYVTRYDDPKAVCGVRLDNGANERLPLVFGDRKLWAQVVDLGRCARCVHAELKANG